MYTAKIIGFYIIFFLIGGIPFGPVSYTHLTLPTNREV